MSKRTDKIAKHKEHIKFGLKQCNHNERVLFVRMYGPQEQMTDAFLYNVDKMAEYYIDEVVDLMPDSKLEWAAAQVEKTIQEKRNGS